MSCLGLLSGHPTCPGSPLVANTLMTVLSQPQWPPNVQRSVRLLFLNVNRLFYCPRLPILASSSWGVFWPPIYIFISLGRFFACRPGRYFKGTRLFSPNRRPKPVLISMESPGPFTIVPPSLSPTVGSNYVRECLTTIIR